MINAGAVLRTLSIITLLSTVLFGCTIVTTHHLEPTAPYRQVLSEIDATDPVLPASLGNVDVIFKDLPAFSDHYVQPSTIFNKIDRNIHTVFSSPGIFDSSEEATLNVKAEMLSFINAGGIFDSLYTIVMRYTIMTPNGDVVYDTRIRSQGTDDTFVGITRLQKALDNVVDRHTDTLAITLRNDLSGISEKYAKLNIQKKVTREEYLAGAKKVNTYYRVKSIEAFLYKKPKTTSKALAKLKQVDLIYATHRTRTGWLLVSENGEEQGWMHSSVLTHEREINKNDAADELAVIARIREMNKQKVAVVADVRNTGASNITVAAASKPSSVGEVLAECAEIILQKTICDELGGFAGMACNAMLPSNHACN